MKVIHLGLRESLVHVSVRDAVTVTRALFGHLCEFVHQLHSLHDVACYTAYKVVEVVRAELLVWDPE